MPFLHRRATCLGCRGFLLENSSICSFSKRSTKNRLLFHLSFSSDVLLSNFARHLCEKPCNDPVATTESTADSCNHWFKYVQTSFVKGQSLLVEFQWKTEGINFFLSCSIVWNTGFSNFLSKGKFHVLVRFRGKQTSSSISCFFFRSQSPRQWSTIACVCWPASWLKPCTKV